MFRYTVLFVINILSILIQTMRSKKKKTLHFDNTEQSLQCVTKYYRNANSEKDPFSHKQTKFTININHI